MKTLGSGLCSRLPSPLSPRVCSLPLHVRNACVVLTTNRLVSTDVVFKGATHYTPRRNPAQTALTALLKPASNGYVPFNHQKMLYEGPDVPNPCYDVPDSEPDIWAIVSGRRLATSDTSDFSVQGYVDFQNDEPVKRAKTNSRENSRALVDGIIPGKGWQLYGEKPGGVCDGEYNSLCGRTGNCPLYGHHDSRGILTGTAYSGWLVFEIPRLEKGFILLKIYTWWDDYMKNTITKDWTSVNNEARNLRSRPFVNETDSFVYNSATEDGFIDYVNDRHLKGDPFQKVPDTYVLEYAIDGRITSLSKDELRERVAEPARVVQLVQLLDDPKYPVKENVEVAVRVTGCGNDCQLSVTHLYWA